MRIGELARRTGISRDTIRFYEKAGLLSPKVCFPLLLLCLLLSQKAYFPQRCSFFLL